MRHYTMLVRNRLQCGPQRMLKCTVVACRSRLPTSQRSIDAAFERGRQSIETVPPGLQAIRRAPQLL